MGISIKNGMENGKAMRMKGSGEGGTKQGCRQGDGCGGMGISRKEEERVQEEGV